MEFDHCQSTLRVFPLKNKFADITLNSLRGTSISIYYINYQVSLRNDIESERKEDFTEVSHNFTQNEHVHPNITFYISIIVFVIVAIIVKFLNGIFTLKLRQ